MILTSNELFDIVRMEVKDNIDVFNMRTFFILNNYVVAITIEKEKEQMRTFYIKFNVEDRYDFSVELPFEDLEELRQEIKRKLFKEMF